MKALRTLSWSACVVALAFPGVAWGAGTGSEPVPVPSPAVPETPKAVATGPTPPPAVGCAEPDAEGPVLASTGCSGVFGLRGSAVDTHGAPATSGSGLTLAGEGEEFVARGLFSAHSSHRFAIGGGGAGFEGTLQAGLAGGFRIPVGQKHGPVFRAGVFGYVRGNDAFYSSLLDLPQVQVGYQYLRGRTAMEVGVTTGAVLTGRFRAGEAETRRLGAGLEVGGYGALHVPWFRITLQAMRLPASDALSSSVRTAEGSICAISFPFAICADGRAQVADAIVWPARPPSEVRSVYAGLSFGFAR
jgi:hypothetical protein